MKVPGFAPAFMLNDIRAWCHATYLNIRLCRGSCNHDRAKLCWPWNVCGRFVKAAGYSCEQRMITKHI